jgi:type IX secretion system PorP/SprF family membrane protein
MKYSVIFSLVLALFSTTAQAQQDAQFSLFPYNQLYWNPAATANDGQTRLQLHNRWQWSGYQGTFDDGGAPKTLVASVQIPLNFIKSAVGVHYVSDKLGAMGSQEVQLSYAYKLKLGENTLAIGARAGLYTRSIDYNVLRARDAGDPLIQTGRIAQSKPDIALGLWYDATTYYVGVSVNHFNQSQFSLGSDKATNPLKPNLYITAGYKWEPLYALEIQPVVMLKTGTDFNLKSASVEAGVIATYNEKIFGGVTYRLSDSVIGILGINLASNRLRVAGAIDFTTSLKDIKSPQSYEIMLSYALPAPNLGGKKTIVRTPRFRY